MTAAVETCVLQFSTSAGGVVWVFAVRGAYSPYRWECSAGHRSDAPHAYAALPFARRDAEAHAEACQVKPGGAS